MLIRDTETPIPKFPGTKNSPFHVVHQAVC